MCRQVCVSAGMSSGWGPWGFFECTLGLCLIRAHRIAAYGSCPAEGDPMPSVMFSRERLALFLK